MKKLFSLLLILIFSFGLAACNNTPGPTDLEQLSEALNELELVSETSENLIFPSTGLNDVTITWESSNTGVITNNGSVFTPWFTTGDAIVTITARLSLGNDTLLKTFEVTVPASLTMTNVERLAEIKESLSVPLEISSNIALPTISGTAIIRWTSSNADYITNTGIVTQPAIGEGDESVTLTATLSIGLSTTTKVFNITINEVETNNFIDIYYINDTHGAILQDDDHMGMSYIANFLVTKKEANPDNVIILAGGDILQGSALSNYYDGLSTINLMNEMYFDAFALGNHEFDWGLETVTAYFDGNIENGEAAFPLLGANTFFEGTSENPEGVEPYTIIERNGLKIGIIGTMGYGLEGSIATSKISGYEFGEPVAIIESYAYHLRTVENVDMVLVVSHDSGRINDGVAALTGDYKVDAIFNAHSHATYADTEKGIPIIQSGSSGKFVGHIRFTFLNDAIVSFTAENLNASDSSLFSTPNTAVQDLIEIYQLETDEIFNVPIIPAGEYLSQAELTYWIARMMRITTSSDIAFHNIGGTRSTIDDGDMINPGVLYAVWPFDNFIKTTWLTGAQINAFKASGDGKYYDTEIELFVDDVYYKVATNDYMFDKEDNPFVTGEFSLNTGLLLRDIAASELSLQYILYGEFFTTNEILSTSLVPDEDPLSLNTQN